MGGKSSSRLNLTGVDVICSILLLSLLSVEFPEYWLAIGNSDVVLRGSLPFRFVIGVLFFDGGVENKFPLALLLLDS